MWIHHQQKTATTELPAGFRARDFGQAADFIRACPAYRPTPLHSAPDLAHALGLDGLLLKDESARFGLRSFKGLGGPYAVVMLAWEALRSNGFDGPPRALFDPAMRPAANLTIACASAGNHAQAVTAGARLIGAACRVFLPAHTEASRVAAIRDKGAHIETIDARYDETVAQARERAKAHDWIFVPDSNLLGDRESARRVMLGYGQILEESEAQWQSQGLAAPSHLVIQGGVGGLPGSLAAWSVCRWGRSRPTLIVVEPAEADCLLTSARAGERRRSAGSLDTVLRGMDCAEPSPLAWEILARQAEHFLSVDDDSCRRMARRLAEGQPSLATSPTGTAGLAGLAKLVDDPAARKAANLDEHARVLAILTEAPA
ncbi:diaminopropionate ammonia-lyase [Gammaproteobacteria bacterium AB-CW1]|uniref:Diaminopropionate ammonia-lyase n=1 Tax=Natronospira elongata TaxID=3110268 RepID=A0AAP6JDK9_9GAMM|nr:diaminopropionate ammonia-lyase [Gammaproteobacteria bacterium AB-CW1]